MGRRHGECWSSGAPACGESLTPPCAAIARQLNRQRTHRLRLQRGGPGPLGGQSATSGAPAQPSAPSTGTPTAADVVASIHGNSPDTQLTARALADMSDEQFNALYNELMAKGDKKKLMDLFGH